MKNILCIMTLEIFVFSSFLIAEELYKVTVSVNYETEELKEHVNQSVYKLHIENHTSNGVPLLYDVYDDSLVSLSLPKGEHRYTLHTRLPQFRQSGRFEVDGDTQVNILHRIPRSFHRKLVFIDQNQVPIGGLCVRFSVHGDTNTHLVNHGRSFLHQGDDETNEKGEIEIRLEGDPPERFRLHVTNHQYSRFYKTLEPSFWDSTEPEINTIERLAFNGEVELSVMQQAVPHKLPAYIAVKYPGHQYGGTLRLERLGVDPARLNLIVRNDSVRLSLYGLPDGEYIVRALSLIVHGTNVRYTMRPADVESETFMVENGQVIPSPRGLFFFSEVPNHPFTAHFSDGRGPVYGVETRFVDRRDGSVYTRTSGADGVVSLELPPGQYALRTVHPLYAPLEKNVMSVEGGVVGRYTLLARPVLSGHYRFPESAREEVRAFSSPAPKTPRVVDVNTDGRFTITYKEGDKLLIGTYFGDGYSYLHHFFDAAKHHGDTLVISMPARKEVRLDLTKIADKVVDAGHTSLILIPEGVSDISQNIRLDQNMDRVVLALVPDTYAVHLIRYDQTTDASQGIAAINYNIVQVGTISPQLMGNTLALEYDPQSQTVNLAVFFLKLMQDWPGKRFSE